jgi:TRAP-type mannitol/chloroaromatic compound transport system permease small subunit
VGEVGIYAFDANKNWLLPFNMDREFNIPTLFSSSIMLACAYTLNEIKKVSEKHASKDWGLLSKIFIFLAIDELFQIHEIFIIPDLRPYLSPALGSTWVIPYTALVIYLGWRFNKFLRSLKKQTRQKFLQSATIFLTGAVGMEVVGSYLVRSGNIRLHSIWYGSITGLEELLEILGLIVFLITLANHLIRQNGAINLHATITE